MDTHPYLFLYFTRFNSKLTGLQINGGGSACHMNSAMTRHRDCSWKVIWTRCIELIAEERSMENTLGLLITMGAFAALMGRWLIELRQSTRQDLTTRRRHR